MLTLWLTESARGLIAIMMIACALGIVGGMMLLADYAAL